MSKRTQQQPPKKVARKGLIVHCAGQASPLTFPNATGWGVDANGILGIGVPSGKFTPEGLEINETIAAFKDWQRVGFA